MEERNAYCRLNDNGDLENVIEVVEIAGENWTEIVTVVSILNKDFAEYMQLAGMGMVVLFDFTRVPAAFNGWKGKSISNTKRATFSTTGASWPGTAAT